MHFIKTVSMLTQRHAIQIPAGQYSALFFYMAGTNAAGQTLALSDLAGLRLNRNGQDFVNADMQYLSEYADLKRGMVDFSSTVAAAFHLGFDVNFSIGKNGDFPNTLNISDDDRVFLHLDFGSNTVDTVLVGMTATCEIYGIPASGVEKYLPQLIQDQIVFSGAGSEKRQAAVSNLHSILSFPSTAANFAKLQIEKDGRIMQDGNYPALAAFTNLDNQKEATAIVCAETVLAQGLRHDELFSEDVYVYPTAQTGAVTISLLHVGALFDNKSTIASKSKMQQDINRNISKKEVAGKIQEVEAIRL